MAAPTDDPPLYMSVRYLRGLFDHLRSLAAPLTPVLDAIGLTEEQLREPDRQIAHALQDAIFAAAERVTGDTNIGLHAGEHTHLMHFGILGQLALSCATGRDLLELHVRYQSLIGNGVRSHSAEHGDQIVLEFELGRHTPHTRHSVEYTLAAQLTLARLLAGPTFTMTRFEVMHAQPPQPSEQERVFGCPLRYACPQMRAHFPASVLTLPLGVQDGSLRSALEAEARKRLEALRVPVHHEDPQVAHLKQYVADRLSAGAPSVGDAATALGISIRSLQRQLELHDLSYRDVVELARREVAERLMADASLTLLDIALLLGFADQTAFNRAFRRWFDTTPGEYRAHRDSRSR